MPIRCPSAGAEADIGAPEIETQPRQPLGRVLWAPWVNMFRPARAAQCIVQASRGAFIASVLLCLSVYCIAQFSAFLYDGTGYLVVTGTTTHTFPNGTTREIPTYGREHRTLGATLRAWVNSGEIGPVLLQTILIVAAVVIGAGFLAWLQWPLVHRGGSPAASLALAYRVVVSAGGLLLFLVLIWGLVASVSSRPAGSLIAGLQVIATVGAPAVLLAWLARAFRPFVERSGEAVAPMCEGCGYDLTHRSSNGRCSECGLETEQSLEPVRRTRAGFQGDESFDNWIGDSLAILLTPHRYYSALRAREGVAERRSFGTRHLKAIGICTALWAALSVAIALGFTHENWMLPIGAALLVPLFGWVTHRFVAAVVCTGWFARGWLPRPASAAVVLIYETAFLWVFCLWNGLLITSFFIWEDWMSRTLGRMWWNNLLNAPTEPLAVLFGNVTLLLIWMVRFHRNLQRVRWSNF